MAAAAPYAQVMEDMRKGRELATQLQGLLRGSPEAMGLVDRILRAMSRTIETARVVAAAAEEGAEEVVSGGGAKRKAAGGGGGDKRKAVCRRRRAQQSSTVTVAIKDLEDGHSWRKYGQKDIQNSKHPKAYFRCTHKYDQRCAAQRQVQRSDDDPDSFRVTYIGVHTCRDPAAAVAPVVLHAADDLHAGSRLISFAPLNNASTATAMASTTTTTTTGNTDHKDDAAALLAGLRPLKLEVGGVGGEQEEVLSSLTPAGSSVAVRNAFSAATPPGPDQGDVTSGLQRCYDDMAPAFNYDDTFDLDDIVVAFGFDQGQR